MVKRTRILVVDDEPALLRFVRSNLTARDYEVITASSGEEALTNFNIVSPDLVVLDIMMPGIDGIEVCQRIRERSQVPIIILTARGEESEKVIALDKGADDYITKPFGVEELLARVRAVLRRSQSPAGEERMPLFLCGDLQMDFDARVVKLKDTEIKLTPTEYQLLRELVLNREKVITHRELLQRIWGPEYRNEKEYLRVFIGRLRRKIEIDPNHPIRLLTESGVGYRFHCAD